MIVTQDDINSLLLQETFERGDNGTITRHLRHKQCRWPAKWHSVCMHPVLRRRMRKSPVTRCKQMYSIFVSIQNPDQVELETCAPTYARMSCDKEQVSFHRFAHLSPVQ